MDARVAAGASARAHSADLSVVVIIPLYNGVKWVEQALRSVLAQTLPPDECIVVDDGSTDGGAGAAMVARLAMEYPITLLHKPNGGQSSARNFGVAHSSSALIAFLDQDDAWYPNHLVELQKPFRKDHGAPLGWVYSDLDRIDENGSLFCKSLLSTLPNEHPKRHICSCLRQDMFVLPSASLISRKAFEAVGGFDERLCGYEDDDLFLRLFRAGYDNVFIPKPLSKWRIYQGSTSRTERMARSRLLYAEKLFAAFPDDRAQMISYGRDLIAPRFIRTAFFDTVLAIWANDSKRRRLNLDGIALLASRCTLLHRITTLFAARVLGIASLAGPAIAAALLLRRFRARH